MSAPTTPPASGTAPDPTSQAGQAGSVHSDPAAAAPSGGDYLARIAQGGDFATTEVRKWQSERSKAIEEQQAAESWIGGLSKYRDRMSGDDLAGHLANYTRLINDPQMAKVLENYFATGQAPGASPANGDGSEDDFYLSEEQKEIRALKAELAEHRNGQHALSANQAKMALQGHFERIQREWGLNAEQAEKVRTTLEGQIGDWSSQGGDGERAMHTLMSPNGYETVEVMAFRALGGHKGVLSHARSQLLNDDQLRQQLTTDVPSSAPSPHGAEPPPVFRTGIEAVQALRAQPELADGTRY